MRAMVIHVAQTLPVHHDTAVVPQDVARGPGYNETHEGSGNAAGLRGPHLIVTARGVAPQWPPW